MISRLATGEISIFYLVFVAEQASLNLTLSDTPKTVFLVLVVVYQLRLYVNFLWSWVSECASTWDFSIHHIVEMQQVTPQNLRCYHAQNIDVDEDPEKKLAGL